MKTAIRISIVLLAAVTTACGGKQDQNERTVDILITGGVVYTGEEKSSGDILDIGVTKDRIVFIGDASEERVSGKEMYDARNLVVAPGFIDPHTHALDDLLSDDRNQNANYLTQGVTTLFAGNDGGGPTEIAATLNALDRNGIGVNVALFVGHNSVRQAVIGGADRDPTPEEIDAMGALLRGAMMDGALGLSSGLYYAPGTFAKIDELVALARIAAEFGGVYESHIRDESSYSVGLLAAISEAIEIGAQSGAPVHIAHIKALGVDVWGESADVIRQVEAARAAGQRITADQYPWAASGTRISNALIPNWAKAGSIEDLYARLRDPSLQSRLRTEIAENLRIRGGADALLIVEERDGWSGKTLLELSQDRSEDAVETAIAIVLDGDARVASFNMQESDIESFMVQPWVATSSDGTDGHPRKYGSFPRKYRRYVRERETVSEADFIRRSTGFVADTFGLCGRGYIRENYYADIVIFDPRTFRENATFADPQELSSGVTHLFVNGTPVISDGELSNTLPGEPLRRGACD